MTTTAQWQSELSGSSLKKQQKYKILELITPDCSEKKCLEIGAETGVVTDFLKRSKGGLWIAGALEQRWVDESRALLGKDVVLIDPREIDYENESFDLVLASRPEHIEDDKLFFQRNIPHPASGRDAVSDFSA